MSKLSSKLQRLGSLSLPHVPVPVHDLPPPSDDRQSRLSNLRAQMERLGKKLERGAQRPRADEEDPPPSYDDEDALPARRHAFLVGASRLPGEVSETPDGPLRVVRTHFDEDHCHGVIPVCSALSASAADVAVLALDPSLAEVDLSRALYIDTETTGLAGGAGTLPFLIGMAWFEGRRLVVEQLLLERPGLEAPMLLRLAERLREASVIVSFNGKSFDWPLLRTRFVLTRVAAPKPPPHLDLLHCARRVYKRRLGSVRLVHLEEQVLGFTRVDDIAGELIPETYLGFLRGQIGGAALAPIVEHNRSDLVALSAMLGEIARRFCAAEPGQDARDQLGFAGVAARAADGARALLFAQGAAKADLRGELSVEAHYLSGELSLRAEDIAGAERAFLRSVECASGHEHSAARAHLALAKLYEHQLKRFAAALIHAHAASELEGDAASARRIARIMRKQALAERSPALAL